MDNNPQQMPKGGIRKTLEEMLNEYDIRGRDGKFPLIRQEAAAELMENYAYQELTQLRAEKDAYRSPLQGLIDSLEHFDTVTLSKTGGFVQSVVSLLNQYPSPKQHPPLIDKLP